jgi:hypothetical protein
MFPALRRKFVTLITIGIGVFVIYGFLHTAIRGTPPSGNGGSRRNRLPPGSTLWPGAVLKDAYDTYGNGTVIDQEGSDELSPVYVFKPGKLKPGGSSYTKMLVVPRTTIEDVTWIAENFGDQHQAIGATVYVVDDPHAPIRPPKNKGHEVMVYLSYIIDHYESLADVNIFMHSHRQTWHNDEILDNDAVQMINRLSPERVQREGYMNMRCQWDPGCPDWMHPGSVVEDVNKKEEIILAKSWSELFPNDRIPTVLAQPCCAQFAVSRDRIRAIPKERYVYYRDWLLNTPLSDSISGRVWEYLWHYVFTGQNVYCPPEHVCYCDGFGVCFGGAEVYTAWWDKMWHKRHYEDELKQWYFQQEKIRQATLENTLDEIAHMPALEPGRNEELERTIMELEAWLSIEKQKAIERGNSAKNRAMEAGREWKEGDGF